MIEESPATETMQIRKVCHFSGVVLESRRFLINPLYHSMVCVNETGGLIRNDTVYWGTKGGRSGDSPAVIFLQEPI